jgi:hypothetical protein
MYPFFVKLCTTLIKLHKVNTYLLTTLWILSNKPMQSHTNFIVTLMPNLNIQFFDVSFVEL